MAMPETTTNVYNRASLGDDYIRLSLKALVTYPKPPAGGKNALPYQKFRLCVPTSDAAHYLAALFWGHNVHNVHRTSLLFKMLHLFEQMKHPESHNPRQTVPMADGLTHGLIR